MRTTRVLAIAAILGIAFSFRVSANVVYDSETTNTWFSVDMSKLTTDVLKSSPWTPPSADGEAVVEGEVIKLDTDLDNPLTYRAAQASEAVAIVAAEMTATVNASEPDLGSVPQAALCVIGTASATNWVGLVGVENGGTNWVTFSTPVPVAGETYSVRIEFDQRQGQSRRIRYRVGDTVLGNGWYPNPKTTDVANIQSVSFSGTGDISGLGGSNVVANAATFNGIGYPTFADALAAAKGSSAWANDNPIVLYKDAAHSATETETLYVNPNGKTFTINGDVVIKTSGNTYAVTAQKDCEAKIDTTYYVTFDEAVTAADASDVIVVNKPLVKDLTVEKSYLLNPNGKLNCAALTVSAGQTLTLAGALMTTTATINGAVAGETLTVKNLTGWNVATLALAENAVITYDADHVLQPTSVSSVTINGLGAVKVGDIVLKAAPTSWTANGLAADKCLEVKNGQLVVASVAEITETSESEGFDYTNGTVSVTATVESGKTGTARLKVIDFVTGNVITAYGAKTIGSDILTWQLADGLTAGQLTPGGTYSYVVEVEVDNVVVATQAGTFTAAKWPSDIWFCADASKAVGAREVHGSWDQTKEPAVVDKAYVIEEDAIFDVDDQESLKGVDHVTRVDAVVTFESLIDTDSLESDETDALGGFVAAKSSDVPQWMALTKVSDKVQWVALTGALAPEANVQYVVRAEIDFQSESKRVRYLVSTDGTDFAPLALENGTQWLALANATKETLAKVELKGAGSLVKFEARVADKALAEVNQVRYDSMEDAFEAAGTNGDYVITLLTNATVEPTKEGKYKISVGTGNYHYVSGGKESSGDKTIIVDEGGKPLVRPSDATMMAVKTPDGNSYQDYDSLRKFLEKNKVEGYTKDNATSGDISDALAAEDTANELLLWQDYALGIDVGTPVDPVTVPAGDTATDGITLSIPTVAAATPSGDYDLSFKVVDSSDKQQGDPSDKADEIKIPLVTGKYRVKVIFTATPAPAN